MIFLPLSPSDDLIDCFPPLIGIRVGDVIIKINETPADDLTMLEAQLEIHESGRYVKIFVKGYEKLIGKRN